MKYLVKFVLIITDIQRKSRAIWVLEASKEHDITQNRTRGRMLRIALTTQSAATCKKETEQQPVAAPLPYGWLDVFVSVCGDFKLYRLSKYNAKLQF